MITKKKAFCQKSDRPAHNASKDNYRQRKYDGKYLDDLTKMPKLIMSKGGIMHFGNEWKYTPNDNGRTRG